MCRSIRSSGGTGELQTPHREDKSEIFNSWSGKLEPLLQPAPTGKWDSGTSSSNSKLPNTNGVLKFEN